jgi:membrane-associated protease RseP (regulator of RpoE activity)
VVPENLLESGRGPAERPAETQAQRFVPPGPRFDPQPKNRLWLHILLFCATLFTTTLVGAQMQYNFSHNLAFFDSENDFNIFSVGMRSPTLLLAGLPFSLTLLTILMAHEFGHFLACVYYEVDATLPFFLPVPLPFTGTLGAFIRIRSAIPSKRVLFDIGIAGPLAGFVFLVPALSIGLAFSKIVPGIMHRGDMQESVPLLEWIFRRVIFPGIPAANIYLHPVVRAAWVGMCATALNLMPAGQLDGGHVIYALFGRAHKWITGAFIVVLLGLGFISHNWFVWAALIFFFARRHPPLDDDSDIGIPRIRLAILALIIFVLCFSITPIIG